MFPLCVLATSGTTVLGAFDPLNEIADICQKHSIWLHVDVSVLCECECEQDCCVNNRLRLEALRWSPGNTDTCCKELTGESCL